MSELSPFANLRQVARAVMELDEAPLFGAAPPFPWDGVAERLKQVLKLPDLAFQSEAPVWLDGSEAVAEFGEQPLFIPLSCPPVDGLSAWVMGGADGKALMRAILGGQEHAAALEDEELREGLVRFVALEALSAARRLGYPPGISPRIIPIDRPPEGMVLATNVTISTGDLTVSGKMLLAAPFVRSWRTHFAGTPPSALANRLQVPVHVQLGSVTLDRQELVEANVGDFLTLDQWTFDPDSGEGSVIFTLDKTPLFQGVITTEGLEISFPPDTYEESIMASDDEEFDDDFDDFEEESEEAPLDEEEQEEETLPPDDEPTESTPEFEEDEYTKAALVSASALPITVSIELGRMRLSADKLLSLQPGNMIDVDVSLEKGVDLVVEGKCVGRGELIRIGDQVGVRILELG